ncbi:MAG: hypothetical protein JWO27_3126 [Frankiales bacterium]|nr:hypothetical protein [Frankiales bacterium]
MRTLLRRHTRLVAFAAIGSLAFLTNSGAALGLQNAASVSSSNGKVTICHGTNSNNNPYIVETPDKDGDVSGHAAHTGPVWDATLKAKHIAWGDIIPPFDYTDSNSVVQHFLGLNWSAAGQAIYGNGCKPVTPPVLALTVVKTNDANGDATFTDSETSHSVGASVPFSVTVTNNGASPLVIDSLVDTVAGNPITFTCTPSLIGALIQPGASASCGAIVAGYSPADGSSKTNTVAVVAHQGPDNVCAPADPSCVTGEDPNHTVGSSDTSTVSTHVPPALSLNVVKENDADGDSTYHDSETASAAGANVPYRVTITNTSAVTVALDGVTDALGAAAAVPVTCAPALPATLAASAVATCNFVLAASSPAAGTSITDTATVKAHEPSDATNKTSGSDTSTVATASAGGTTGGTTGTTTGTTGTTTGTTTGGTTGATTGATTGDPTTGGTTGTTTGGQGGGSTGVATTGTTTGSTSGGTSGDATTGDFTGGGGTIVVPPELPFTGAPVASLLAAAAGLVGVGCLLLLVGVRRRA